MTDDEHARFLVKIQELSLKKTSLIRDFIEAFAAGEPNIMAWLEKDLTCKKSKRWFAVRKREAKKEALMRTDFNLEQKDVSEIFDILAEADDEQ